MITNSKNIIHPAGPNKTFPLPRNTGTPYLTSTFLIPFISLLTFFTFLPAFLPSCPPALSNLPVVSPSFPGMQVSNEPKEVIEVFEAMYRFNLPEAEIKLKALNATNIDQNWIDLAHVNLLWWWLISGDTSRDYDNLMAVVLNRVINRVQSKPAEVMTNEEVFTMIHCYAYLTRVDIYQERYFKGIANLRHTMKFLDLALIHTYDYDKFMMVTGLYNYFAAVTQVKYPVFTPFFAFAPKSDRNLGFQLLNRCAGMDNILIRNESLYYLMKINYQLEENFDRSLNIADQLIAGYPNNLIYHFHRFMILIEAERKPQAMDQYRKIEEVSKNAPGLNTLQRTHLVDIAKKRLLKEKINPAL